MKYQMTCPNCHYEFQYDNGYFDKNLERLGREIKDITLQLAKYKTLPEKERHRLSGWNHRTKVELVEKQKDYAELKNYRKLADQQVKKMEFHIFKRLVREKIGEPEYLKMIEMMEKEMEAYKVSGLMLHEYTRSAAKSSVTSINKL